ncbi:ROK family transcriptional regulator [Microbacterium sp. ASV49]|uniref:ROK family transcriptional regulator n=1 Tax=Microbacterium candidum TaxID=3041922 RepID=A0ABT7N478_9MICO|nr:ROK family transcriptional regulator [Microbacterium sp. ASV49]MDL9981515.1 ROK family transcriptional regulator [Microbacterium sp. ASV49]
MVDALAGSPALLRALNARAVLDVLAEGAPLSRADIMQRTGLSRTAVTQLLRALEAYGAVVPAGLDRHTRGPAAKQVVLSPTLGIAVAAHVGHERVEIALVDVTGTVRARESASREPDVAAQISALVASCHSTTIGYVQCAVVAVAGIVDAAGTIRNASGSDDGRLRDSIQAALAVPVTIENDVNLAALAEMKATGGSEQTFAYVSVTGGLGSAIVVDGTLHRGRSGGAGEIGYLPQPGLEVGMPALDRPMLAELAASLGFDAAASVEEILDAASAGHAAATRVADLAAQRIAVIAASLRLVLDPDMIVLAALAAHPAVVEGVRRRLDVIADQLPVPVRPAVTGDTATLDGACIHASVVLRDLLFTRIVSAPTEGPRS